jgi:hypothetical protein
MANVRVPNSDAILHLHFIDSTGFEVNGTMKISTARKVGAEGAVYRGLLVSRKDLGC